MPFCRQTKLISTAHIYSPCTVIVTITDDNPPFFFLFLIFFFLMSDCPRHCNRAILYYGLMGANRSRPHIPQKSSHSNTLSCFKVLHISLGRIHWEAFFHSCYNKELPHFLVLGHILQQKMHHYSRPPLIRSVDWE